MLAVALLRLHVYSRFVCRSSHAMLQCFQLSSQARGTRRQVSCRRGVSTYRFINISLTQIIRSGRWNAAVRRTGWAPKSSQVKQVKSGSQSGPRSECCGPSRRGSGRQMRSLDRCDKPQVPFLPYRRFLNEGEKRLCNLRRITVKVRNASRRFESHLAEAGDGRGCRPMAGDHVQKCRVRSL